MPKTSKSNRQRIATTLAVDNLPQKHFNPHAFPIFTSSTYVYESVEGAQKVFEGKEEAFIYSRWTNPNAELVEAKLEALESAGLSVKCKALVFASGMSAISALFQSILKPGDTLIAQGNIYGTSVDYFNHYGSTQNIKVVYVDMSNLTELESTIKKHKSAKLIYAETPSNPSLACYDLKAIAALGKKYGVKTAVDNTFASPLLQQPFRFGIDFIVHSSTKYLNGHGNGLSGFLLSTDIKFMNDTVWKIRKLNGTICSAFDAWMLNTGLKTLPLRMKQHCSNAIKVAAYLDKHPKVSRVYYPGLKSHPDHLLAKKQMLDFGGVLAFELKGGYKEAKKMLSRLRHCKLTASLGTIDTLIQHPASMSHYFMPKKQREQYGISDGLVRLSIGIEYAEDIIDDLNQAL